MAVRYRVFFEPEDDGRFHVYCPALPGCHSYADTEEEALANIREAMIAYIESRKKDSALTKRINVVFPIEEYQRLKAVSKEKHITIAEYIRGVVLDLVEKESKR